MLIFTALTWLLAVVSPNVHGYGDGLTVNTKQGDVLGTQASPNVRRFLGIPYAEVRRWEAPQNPQPRNTIFKAFTFGPSCPQAVIPSLEAILDPSAANSTLVEAEDCLSMNIWAPSIHRKQKTAVMVWIYGGDFQVGSTNISVYDGQTLVQNHDDVTVVSFNYRLNIIGQPGAPQLYNQSRSQNFGLLDIDAAVQWIYENIAEFGGDPERIVLFGESAGGVAVDAYTYAYPQDKRVKAVIQQSGSLGLPGITGATNGTFDPTPWNTVANVVGCGNVTGGAQLNCMKGVPFKVLASATAKANTSFYPIADGITIFADTRARAAAGNFLQVPLLGGTTAHESDIFVVAGGYLSLGYAIPVLTEILSDLDTQLTFACTAAMTFNDRIKANVPMWRYLFSGVFRSISPLPELRAYHGSEISFVFGTAPPLPEELALSMYMQGVWVAFARDPTNGLNKYGWPRYTPSTASLGELGGFYNRTGVHFLMGERVDYTCRETDTLQGVLTKLLEAFPELASFFF